MHQTQALRFSHVWHARAQSQCEPASGTLMSMWPTKLPSTEALIFWPTSRAKRSKASSHGLHPVLSQKERDYGTENSKANLLFSSAWARSGPVAVVFYCRHSVDVHTTGCPTPTPTTTTATTTTTTTTTTATATAISTCRTTTATKIIITLVLPLLVIHRVYDGNRSLLACFIKSGLCSLTPTLLLLPDCSFSSTPTSSMTKPVCR